MYTRAQVLAALAAISATDVNAAMGPAFSTGPVSDDFFIREAISTLILRNGPSGGFSDAITSLWVGMGTSNGDLIQSIADNWQQKQLDHEPIYGYGQADGTKGDKVTMHYKFDGSTGSYTQTVLINDKTASTLSTSDGKALGWGSAIECAEDNCDTVGDHSWTNATIILDVADPNYINALAKGCGVSGDMSTSDSGKTWTVTTINIPVYSFSS
ncbi:hypothetical protein AnigIFM59636_003003 [Aspergillus niger]|uniref:Uncharacterized protein n=1 Tax=Aspergillus vadensis (strain CBS 113365 / IMI 142717 / IBT 24658) TaxID=1448311 RepID=A0A319B2P5_ASPVC|nr:hypothetical protein BO88DRAFT_427217 [Aspergillus vadensis CBS 113365]PYH67006.1 hypothetical protein BO88DRAFT_427217 [Aspergillus vadensis CBS 113365]GKZ98406.1 hypothetical protein AnigIFM59636_003003 [Aspergillus niger]